MPTLRPMTQNSDLYQTPKYAVDILVPFLRRSPSDFTYLTDPACGRGNIVRHLNDSGLTCTGHDIDPSQISDDNKQYHYISIAPIDFLTQRVGRNQAIVTNPPYSSKGVFLRHCYLSNRPFALLMPITTLENDKGVNRQQYLGDVEIIIPDCRVAFETPDGRESKPHLMTAWFTRGLDIGRQITFVHMERPSRRRRNGD